MMVIWHILWRMEKMSEIRPPLYCWALVENNGTKFVLLSFCAYLRLHKLPIWPHYVYQMDLKYWRLEFFMNTMCDCFCITTIPRTHEAPQFYLLLNAKKNNLMILKHEILLLVRNSGISKNIPNFGFVRLDKAFHFEESLLCF